MSHLKIKQIAGPTNGKTGSVIIFDNTKPEWSSDLTSALFLPTGTEAQRPQIANNGMIRFNTDSSRIELYSNDEWVVVNPDLSVYLRRYTFRMEYTADQKVGTISELPDGWTVVTTNNTDFTIDTGLGKTPAGGYMYGLVSVTDTQYQLRTFNTSVSITYNTSDLNKFQIKGITSPSFIGTVASGHVYFHVFI
jgi:hypothetical protein